MYMVGGIAALIFQALILRPWVKIAGSRKMSVVMGKPNRKRDMAFVKELAETGKIKSIIDKRVGLSEVSEALEYVEDGHALGKVVITL